MTNPLELPAVVAKEVTNAGHALLERTRSQVALAQRVVSALPCLGRHAASSDATSDEPSSRAALTVVPPIASDDATSDDDDDEVATVDPAGQTAPAVPVAVDAPQVTELAIPDYDSLAASQVVPRLASLTTAELGDVGAYERSHRARQTILNRVRQLQSAAEG